MGVVDVGTIESFGFGNDPIVIRRYIAGYQGGRVLDVSDFTEEFIRCGHIIIRDNDKEVEKPLGISEGKYVSLPANCEYVGVATSTKSKDEPFVGIMYSGEVNDIASPYPIDDVLKAALKTAIPTLVFKHD
ncbi:hypothetical protein [uncultured Parabacteroides sp.]|uniref:hypothetical protein n=1 Tax=uncultured Parabacteroides sp. TaxID=512312 RepID=UPI0026369D0C|nr:hypothetical protein [uncultured Parabacteroides sp.]